MLSPPEGGGEAVVLFKMLEPAMSLGTSEGVVNTQGRWESPGGAGWQQDTEFVMLPALLLEKTLFHTIL